MTEDRPLGDVQALLFDVFGTVVDWRGSLIREIDGLASEVGVDIDGAELADSWRARYGPSMNRVLAGELPYQNLDDLHRASLVELLDERGVELTRTQIERLVTAWHRLDAWPDSVAALVRLKRRYLIATMSNGNVALLAQMAKHADLPWDVILTPELMRTYKKDLESYRYVISLLGLEPHQTMMVAAHEGELEAVGALGMRTAYVSRPLEHGTFDESRLSTSVPVDLVCRDLGDLADRLGV